MKQRSYILVLAALILLMLAISLSGCGSYKEFSFEKDDVRFSAGGVVLEHPLFTFEYPSSFQEFKPDSYNPDFTEIILNTERWNWWGLRGISGTIFINVLRPGLMEETDAKSIIDNVNYRYRPEAQFTTIERSITEIAGQKAESLVYSFDEDPENSRIRVVRMVAFDYDGFVWNFLLYCEEKSYSELELGFQHLLKTFMFTDQKPEIAPN